MTTTKKVIYGVLLVLALLFASYSYVLSNAPLGTVKLYGQSYLAQVPNMCETCEQTLFYWVNKNETECSITVVTTNPVESIDEPETVKSLYKISLENFKNMKGENKYIFDAFQNESFKKKCYDFSK